MVDCKENDKFDLGVKGLIGINNRDVAYKLMECNLNFTLQALSLYHPCLWQDKKNLSISLSISKLTISLILFTNMTISTLLILAVCRTCVYYFLTGLNHHSLCGSVVEHLVVTRWKNIFLYFLPSSKLTISRILFTSLKLWKYRKNQLVRVGFTLCRVMKI